MAKTVRISLMAACVVVLTCFSVRVACSQQSAGSDRASVNVPDLGNTDGPVVGAYYYPWYEHEGSRRSWRNVFRLRLEPPQKPKAGLYSSRDPNVVKEHIAQSRRAGISFWAVSWWGPESLTDRNLREAILNHPDAEQLRFAVLYETTGRFGDFDTPDYSNWLTDLDYLNEHYFRHPHYLRINNRPVLFIYLSRVYFRNRGQAQIESARQRNGDLYLVGDDVFGGDYRPEWARWFDAVTAYDVYGQSVGIKGTTRDAVALLAANYRRAHDVCTITGTAFIPAVAPGYNDTVIRDGHPAMPRYFVDDNASNEGDVFRAMIQDAALPNLDRRCGQLMMVTSFNEWYEDSQIEATSGEAPVTRHDTSAGKQEFTAGHQYEDYSFRYLDVLRETVRRQ
jgi:hypothetical protein